jgi:drug/metabolite transporter (DMT)-like permease
VIRRGTPWRVYAALFGASILWASLYTAAKPAVTATGAMQVTLARVVLAAVCLTPLVLARGGRPLLTRHLRLHWRGIALLGLLNFGTSQVLALSALNFLPASVNSVLNNTHPLWVALGTVLLLTVRQPLVLLGGSAVALIGVGLIFLPDLLLGPLGQITPVGVALSLAGSGVIALGTVVGRSVMRGSDPLAVSALASSAAILPVTGLTLVTGGVRPILEAPVEVKLLLVYVGIGCTAVNFALWYYGLKHLPAAAAAAFQYLIAPMGVIIAAVFLHEPLSATLLVGTGLIVLGLALTQLARTESVRTED